MIELLLQVWGGLCYLFNKIFFSMAERSNTETFNRSWRMRSWLIYILGLPAWIIVFLSEHNWIAASVELGGAPSMIVGYYISWKGFGKEPLWLDNLAKYFVIIGLSISFYEFGGINTVAQLYELGIAAGFLMGTYLMAKNNIKGYLWLMLGNVSCASLMHIEGYYLLMFQQLLSLIFVTDAFMVRKKSYLSIKN
jgi:hypothetical protein